MTTPETNSADVATTEPAMNNEAAGTEGATERQYHDDDYIGTHEAAGLVYRTPHALENLRYLGRGPRYSQPGGKGGRVMYRVGDLRAWLRKWTVDPESRHD